MTVARRLYQSLTTCLFLNPPSASISPDMTEDLSGVTAPLMLHIYRNSLRTKQFFKISHLSHVETAVR